MESAVNEQTLVIYHANCMDGLAAASVITFLETHTNGKFDYLALNYQQDFAKALEGRFEVPTSVLVVDFSFSPEEMSALFNNKNVLDVVIFDHHATAIKKWEGIDWGDESVRIAAGLPKMHAVFDTERSGAKITYDTINEYLLSEGAPIAHYRYYAELIQYIQDRDLWAWKLPESRNINTALRKCKGMTPKQFANWATLVDINELIVEGRAVNDYKESLFVAAVKHMQVVKDPNNKAVGLLNVSLSELTSELAEYVYLNNPELDYVCIYVLNPLYPDGRVIVSLRSSKTKEPVIGIAESFGGGGHPHSCGFSMSGISELKRFFSIE